MLSDRDEFGASLAGIRIIFFLNRLEAARLLFLAKTRLAIIANDLYFDLLTVLLCHLEVEGPLCRPLVPLLLLFLSHFSLLL